MTEAVALVMDYAFSQLGSEKLIFANATQNNRSARIKEKTGARLIRRTAASFVDSACTEQNIYELTKEEWLIFRSTPKV